MLIGIFARQDSRIASSPWPMQTASRPDAAWAGVAPAAAKPCSTTVKALAKPTMAASTPAATGCSAEPPRGAVFTPPGASRVEEVSVRIAGLWSGPGQAADRRPQTLRPDGPLRNKSIVWIQP